MDRSRLQECDSRCSEAFCENKCERRFAHEARRNFTHLCNKHEMASSQVLKDSTVISQLENNDTLNQTVSKVENRETLRDVNQTSQLEHNVMVNECVINVENKEGTDLKEIKNEFNYETLSEKSSGSKKRGLLSTINVKGSELSSIYGNSFMNNMPQENDLKEISSNDKVTKKSFKFGLCCCND